MGLPDHEERALEQIERQLVDDDPRFAARLTRTRSWRHVSRRVLYGSALSLTYLVGLLTIIAGTTLPSAFLIVIGALITATFPVVVAVRAWRWRRH